MIDFSFVDVLKKKNQLGESMLFVVIFYCNSTHTASPHQRMVPNHRILFNENSDLIHLPNSTEELESIYVKNTMFLNTAKEKQQIEGFSRNSSRSDDSLLFYFSK